MASAPGWRDSFGRMTHGRVSAAINSTTSSIKRPSATGIRRPPHAPHEFRAPDRRRDRSWCILRHVREEKKSKKISVCYKGTTRKVKKQDWKKKYKGASKEPNCGAGCCTDTFCFAETVSPTDGQPTSFGCCPPELTCTSQSSLPDQCCYPGESCRPDLAVTFGIEVETNCCRPCPARGKDGCCIHAVDECIAGTCQPPGTARLPRNRRL